MELRSALSEHVTTHTYIAAVAYVVTGTVLGLEDAGGSECTHAVVL